MACLYWALTAALFWGLGPVFAKMGLEKPDPLTALLVRSTAVLIVLIVWAALKGDMAGKLSELDSRTWTLLILEGGVASVIAHYALFQALKLGDVANVVPITASYPLIAILLSVVLLGSRMTWGKGLGAALTVLGIYLLQRF